MLLRKTGLYFLILFVCFSLSQLSLAYAEETVSSIVIEGNERIEKETVLSYMRVVEGDNLNEAVMNNALKNLFATGMFADIKMSADNGVLKVTVKENPIVNQLYLEGNKRLEDEQLLDELQLKPL